MESRADRRPRGAIDGVAARSAMKATSKNLRDHSGGLRVNSSGLHEALYRV